MKFRFRFITSTLVRLRTALNKAYDRGDARLVRRISALLAYGQGQEVSAVADDLSVSPETVYSWLRAFLVDRFASLAAAQILAGRVICQKVTIQFMNFT